MHEDLGHWWHHFIAHLAGKLLFSFCSHFRLLYANSQIRVMKIRSRHEGKSTRKNHWRKWTIKRDKGTLRMAKRLKQKCLVVAISTLFWMLKRNTTDKQVTSCSPTNAHHRHLFSLPLSSDPIDSFPLRNLANECKREFEVYK